MPVPLTGVVTLVLIFAFLLYLSFFSVERSPGVRDRLLRPSLGFAPFAALALLAMGLGQTIDDNWYGPRLLFDGVGMWANLAIGAILGTVTYVVPVLRNGAAAWFCYVFARDRATFRSEIGPTIAWFVVVSFVFAFMVNLNADFPMSEAEYERRLNMSQY